MAPQPRSKPVLQLAVGDSYYTVLEPSDVTDASGIPQYAVMGPFGTLFDANAFAAGRPGSLLVVSLVQHEIPAAAVAPVKA